MDWSKFVQNLVDSIKAAFISDITEVKNQAIQAGKEFLDKNKDDILKWTQQCESGELKENELKILLDGKKDLLKIVALKQQVLGKVALQKFITECTSILFNALVAFIP